RLVRGPQSQAAPPGRAPRACPHRASRFHVSGAQGLAVRCLPGTADVRRAVGSWAGKSRETGNGKRETGDRKLAHRLVPGAGAETGAVRVLFARRTGGPLPVSRFPFHVVVVASARDAPRASRRRARLGAGERAARDTGTRPAALAGREALCQPRVRDRKSTRLNS